MILICRKPKRRARKKEEEEEKKKSRDRDREERSDVGCFYPFIISSPHTKIRKKERKKDLYRHTNPGGYKNGRME